jgi:hypothetical protein
MITVCLIVMAGLLLPDAVCCNSLDNPGGRCQDFT